MGRQNSDAAIVGPSIALLQERFRQLQRIREKREERRLLDLFSQSKQFAASSNGNHPQSGTNFSFSHELILPSRLHFQDPFLLGLDLNSKHADCRDIRTQPPMPADTKSMKTPQKFDISDVDTSLHL